jgi:peptidoglycan/xylan/chitin deacetylase (PgdA/CDA1 family)
MKDNNHFDETEDFSLEMDSIKEITEDLEKTINELNKKIDQTMNNVEDEIHISDIDEDFTGVIRRHDYRGKIEEPKPLPSRSSRRKLKKWVYVLIAAIILIIGGVITGVVIHNKNEARRLAEEKAIIDNIKSHFHEHSKISKDTKLYEKKDKEYKEIGTIYKDVNVDLVKEDIKLDTKYFQIKDLDYYVSFEDVSEGEEQKKDERYKNYLPFNINIITKDSFTMYDGDNKLITLNKEMEFPVIINNFENKYYVEYNGMLVSIKKDEVSKTKENKNTDKKNQSKITTLAYHRVYDTGDKCTDGYVCMKKANFDKQMKYLADNKYFTLNMDEMYMYMKGNLQIAKGVVVTIDDGLLFKAADEILDKYGLNATMFVATAAYKNYDQFKGLKAIENQSHTHNLHRNYVCTPNTSYSQGGAILCMSKANIVADLKKSVEILEVEPKAMAFPFYDFNDNAIAAVKEAGFKMAFIGRAGVMGRATPKVTNMYKIPRMTVWEEYLMSFNEWKSYL